MDKSILDSDDSVNWRFNLRINAKFFIFCFLLLICGNIFGAYVNNHPISVSQPDGSKLELLASGDEFYNWLHDKDGYTIKQNDKGWYVFMTNDPSGELVFTDFIVGRDRPSAMGLRPNANISGEKMKAIRSKANQQLRSIGSGRAPSTGTLNNISIFIRFSDQTEFGQNISTYNNLFNGTTGNTMQSYFLEASYNALNISTTYYPIPSTTVVSWQDSHPRAYYSPYSASNTIGYSGDSQRTDREFTLLVNAVNGVRSQIPTSLNLDGDNDGRVDNVCFIIKGNSDGWSDLLWPHRWSIYDRTVNINGKRVYDFNFQLSEFIASSGVGVLCHEMFHSLGSPDLYHYTSNGITPVGSWDLMENDGNPPQHMGAFMKYKYGHWISSIPALTTDGTYTLNPLTSATNNCYKIASPNSSTEYFVVEYRRKTGTFENSLPGTGLLVYRINPAAEGNADGPPDEVYIYRPGGTTSANGTVNSANYSLETGRTAINSSTNPTPFLSSGAAGGLNISQIGSAGASISFVLGNPTPGAPVCSIDSPIAGTAFNLNSTISVTATASDTNGSIANVAFYVNDVLKYTDSSSPYSWSWNTSGYSSGEHIIKAIATDNSSLTATSSVNILLMAPADEGFETGNFSAFAWSNSSASPWTVQSADKLSGSYAAKSGAISDNQTTELSLSMNVTSAGNISFYQKVSSESNYDYLRFYLDNAELGAWSGAGTWTSASYPVTTGNHTFKWTYVKDGSVASGSDCAFLDHIIFPPHGVYFAPPQNFSATAGNTVVNLSWQAPASGSPSSYKIFRNSALLTTTGATAYTDNAVVNGVSYTYYVKAVYSNPAGESEPSNSVTVTPSINSTITIGSGTNTNTHLPVEPYYGYTYSQSIILQSEINLSNHKITKIAWYYNGNEAFTDAIVVYMGHTANTSFSSSSAWVPLTSLTQVYSGNLPATATAGWIELTLDTPFLHNNTQNLVIAVDENTAGYHSSSSEFFSSSVSGNRSIYYYNDSTNPNPASPPTSGNYLGINAYIPNTKLTLEPLTPVIEVNPISLAFDTVLTNTTSTNSFQISNPGTALLSGSITTPTGYSVALGRQAESIVESDSKIELMISDDRNSLAYSIPEGGSSSFNLSFNPTAVQAYNGSVTITHNAGGADKIIALTGQGGKPTLGRSATAFTASLAPNASSSQTLTISNSGNMALNYSLAESGTVPWLSLNGGSSVSNTIAVSGAAQNVSIGFNATGLALGTYNATINGTSNDPALPTFSINVTLYVQAAMIAVDPATLSFGVTELYSVTTQNFTISNSGNIALSGNITSPDGYNVAFAGDAIAALGTASDTGTRNTFAYVVPAGAAINYAVSFSPTAVQLFAGDIVITHNAGGANRTIAVSGAGGIPVLEFNPTSFTFEMSPNSNASQVLSLSNPGNLPLTYDLGDFSAAPWLTLNGSESVSGTIAAGSFVNISLEYNTAGLEPFSYQAMLRGTSNDPNHSIYTIDIDLNVTAPVIGINPSSCSFGTVRINTTVSQDILISNTGSATLTGSISTPPGYSIASGRASVEDLSNPAIDRNTLEFSVPAGQAAGFSLSFNPTAVTAYNGNLVISHNAGSPELTIPLSGQGGLPVFNMHPSGFSLSMPIDGWEGELIGINNYGNLPLDFSLSIDGSPAWLSFEGQSTYTGSVPINSTTFGVIIAFDATGMSPGTYLANISGTSNDPNHLTFSIPITLNLYDPGIQPVMTSFQASPAGVNLSWNPVPFATSYKVFRALEPDGSFQFVGSRSSCSFQDPAIFSHAFYRIVAVYPEP